MANDAHQQLEIARRRQQVADLYLQRFTQATIAERLGVSQATVCNDLKKIRAEWRNSAIRDFDQSCELELRTIDWVQRESAEAWERSKKPAQSAVIHGDGTSSPTRKTLKNQNGDPRFLDAIQKCISARCALLGLNAPQRLGAFGARRWTDDAGDDAGGHRQGRGAPGAPRWLRATWWMKTPNSSDLAKTTSNWNEFTRSSNKAVAAFQK